MRPAAVVQDVREVTMQSQNKVHNAARIGSRPVSLSALFAVSWSCLPAEPSGRSYWLPEGVTLQQTSSSSQQTAFFMQSRRRSAPADKHLGTEIPIVPIQNLWTWLRGSSPAMPPGRDSGPAHARRRA